MSSESEDEGLRKAIALSLQGQSGVFIENAITVDSNDSYQQDENKLHTQISRSNDDIQKAPGILGIDRKAMEAERLARLKRKREPNTPTTRSVATRLEEPQSAAAMPKATVCQRRPAQVNTSYNNDGSRFSVARSTAGKHFQGIVRKTHVQGYKKAVDTITLEEVLQAEHLQMAVLSSFQWDIPWLYSKLTNPRTLVTLIMQAKDEETKQQYRHETADNPRLRLCFPPMDGGAGCMHSKLMLLSFPEYLRIVVPTANLVTYDWGETGVMENMVFLIDLPRLFDSHSSSSVHEDDFPFFGQELIRCLRAMNVEDSIVKSLSKFDFTRTKDLAFVHTIAGNNIGTEDPWRRTGHCGLAEAVKYLDLVTEKQIDFNYVSSSIGALQADFLGRLYRACQGFSSADEITRPTRKKKNVPEASSASDPAPDLDSNVRLYYPSSTTVRSSKAKSAGTICLQSKWYDAPTFPRQLFRDCQSVRGLLMHNKLILINHTPSSATTSEPIPAEGASRPTDKAMKAVKWAYLGSANCSESAWGNKITKDRSTGKWKMYCRNWECGVLFPAEYVDQSRDDSVEEFPPTNIHNEAHNNASTTVASVPAKEAKHVEKPNSNVSDTNRETQKRAVIKVPIPMIFPGRKYNFGERPWFHDG